jgi:hypothetical protein
MSNPYQAPGDRPTARQPNAIQQLGFLYIAVLVVLTLLCLALVVSTYFFATFDVSNPAETRTVPGLKPGPEVLE